MLIAQITDMHVVPRGETFYEQLDTNAMLAQAVTHLNDLDPPVDLVLVTGDLTEHGTTEEYETLRELLGPLRAPFYMIPGNHDDRDTFLRSFEDIDYLPEPGSPFAHYVVEDHALRLIGLDTTVPGTHDGLFCDERLSWLDAQLGATPERPTLLFMHTPPFETGIKWMDASGVVGGRRMAEVVRRHSQVVQVLCGHIHRPIHVAWGGTTASVAPGTAHQIALTLGGIHALSIVMEPPAVQLHAWLPPLGLVSHLSYIASGVEPFRLQGLVPEGITWEQVDEHYQRGYDRMRDQEYE